MLRQRSSVNYSENFAAERACPATSSSAELGQTALTIRQPFASGIMLGHKTVENRSWGQGLLLPANGAWIVVHAAKEPADAKDPNLAALREAWTDMPSVVELPRGAVLGWMCVRAVVPHGAAQPHPELAADRQASGPWCWLIDRVARLAQPVEDVPGAQSLWAWPAPPLLQVPPGVTPWMRSAADRADRAENAAARSGGAGSSRPPAAVEAEPPHAARVAAVTAAAERLRGAPHGEETHVLEVSPNRTEVRHALSAPNSVPGLSGPALLDARADARAPSTLPPPRLHSARALAACRRPCTFLPLRTRRSGPASSRRTASACTSRSARKAVARSTCRSIPLRSRAVRARWTASLTLATRRWACGGSAGSSRSHRPPGCRRCRCERECPRGRDELPSRETLGG